MSPDPPVAIDHEIVERGNVDDLGRRLGCVELE
jgi:hypothetical protein